MRRFVLAVSLAHLVLLGGYVKLGAIRPWQALTYIFGGGYLWVVMLLSAAAAPFLLGAVAWAIDSFLRRMSNSWIRKIRESSFVVLSTGALMSFGITILRTNQMLAENLYVFISKYFLIVATIAVFMGLALFSTSLVYTTLCKRLTQLFRSMLYILSPLVLFSTAGVFYVLVLATPPEHSREPPSASARSSLTPGLPKNVIVLLFDAFSYGIAFSNGQVDERLPNLRALVEQSLVFHNVPSFSGGTRSNVPVMLTGQVYANKGIKLDRQLGEVVYQGDETKVALKNQRNLFDLAYDQGYHLAVFGTALRYCSTFVKDKGYCQSIAIGEYNPEPRNFVQASLEIYRLAVVSNLPAPAEHTLQSILGSTILWRWVEARNLKFHNATLTFLKDAKGNFVYAHYPVPHSPYVRFDPQTRELRGGATYFDSVRTVDFFLGEIRQALQDLGVWDDTLLIVLSDHNGGGISDVRIPLIIKLPQMKQRVDFEGLWTHAQFLPLLEELFKRRAFDPETVLNVVRTLAPPEK